MIKVYIASPYTLGDHLENVNVQFDMYSELMDLGFAPFAPLYSHFINERHQKSYDAWMQVDYEWIDVCDCLLRLPGESVGADLEVSYAMKIGIPVYYSLEELTMNAIKEKNMTKSEFITFMKEELKLDDHVILVRNQADVVKADKILSKIGLPVFSAEIRKEWETQEKEVYNNFLIKDDDCWRIQSHYIGFGVSVDLLEEKLIKINE